MSEPRTLQHLESGELTIAEDAKDDPAPEKGSAEDDSLSSRDFPDGGLEAWLSMIGASFVMFVTYGMASAFGVFQDYYTDHLLNGESPSNISWIGSSQTCFLFGLGIITGKLFDHGYYHSLLVTGSIMYLVSFFMISLCQPGQYYQFLLAQGFGMGLGMGLMAIPTVSVISHHFSTRRGTANGLVFSGTSLGGIFWPLILNHLIRGQLGFATGIRVAAFVCLGLLICAHALVRTRFEKLPRSATQTASTTKNVLTDGVFMLSLVGLFVISLGLSFPFVYLELFASMRNVSARITLNSLTILYSSATIFGRIIPGILSDRFGPLNVYTFIGGALVFAMFGVHSSATVIIFAILYGPCNAACQSMFPTAIASFTQNVHEFGFRLGVAAVAFGVGSLVGTPITGALLRAPHYDWSSAIVFSGTTVLAGSGILLFSRQLLVKRKGTSQV